MVRVQLNFTGASFALCEELVEVTKTTSVFYRVDDIENADVTFVGELPEIALVVYRWNTMENVDIEDFMNMHDSIEMAQLISNYEI